MHKKRKAEQRSLNEKKEEGREWIQGFKKKGFKISFNNHQTIIQTKKIHRQQNIDNSNF